MSYSARITENYTITRIKGVIVQEVLIISAIAQEVLYNYYLSVRPLVLSNTLSQMWDKHLVSRFPSDLMKSTVVDESLSSFKN